MNSTKTTFAPIKSKRIFEEVSYKIKRSIFSGDLKIGERLPSEIEMARQFNVSRHAIREALRTLELSGFLIVKKGVNGGPIVRNTIVNTISDLYLDAFQMEKVTLEELTTGRLEIEISILVKAIENIEEFDIKRLQKNIKVAKEKVNNGIIATEENIQFHKLLAEASKNRVFMIVSESITTILDHFLNRLDLDLETSRNVVVHHEKILEAIIDKNQTQAIRFLTEHLQEVRNQLTGVGERKKVDL